MLSASGAKYSKFRILLLNRQQINRRCIRPLDMESIMGNDFTVCGWIPNEPTLTTNTTISALPFTSKIITVGRSIWVNAAIASTMALVKLQSWVSVRIWRRERWEMVSPATCPVINEHCGCEFVALIALICIRNLADTVSVSAKWTKVRNSWFWLMQIPSKQSNFGI